MLVSLLSIIFSEVKYYQAISSFLDKKTRPSSCKKAMQVLFFFIWKLLLLLSRLVVLALFASVEPNFVFVHFVSSWLLLFFTASYIEMKQKDSKFMKCGGGECLFRGTVALIWYFSWFSGVLKGKISKLMLIYHIYMLVDICVLCGLWYWRISSDPNHFQISSFIAMIIPAIVLAIYIIGLLFKTIHFIALRPKVKKEPEHSSTETFHWCDRDIIKGLLWWMVCCFSFCMSSQQSVEAANIFEMSKVSEELLINKRMEELAETFYPQKVLDEKQSHRRRERVPESEDAAV